MATPTPERSDGPRGAVNAAARRSARPWPEPSSTALIARMAATLIPVLQFWTLALWRVPRTFTAPTTAIIRAATRVLAVGSSGTNWRRYSANATARVATDPEEITKNNVQPSRNAASGPNASRT